MKSKAHMDIDASVGGADDCAFAQRLRDQLRESETLDYVTAARLSAARRRALAGEAGSAWLRSSWGPRASGRWSVLVSAGAAALALLIAVWMPTQTPPALEAERAMPRMAQADTFEVLLDENELEFYEDLDLYRWLSEDAGGSV